LTFKNGELIRSEIQLNFVSPEKWAANPDLFKKA